MNTTLPCQQSSQEINYLETWMSKVSRSFVVVVAALEEPLRSYMASAYLLCRVIDNVEDCTAPTGWKNARFQEISQMIEQPKLAQDILRTWDGAVWVGLTEDEKKIMSSEDGLPLWQIFSQFPDEVMKIIRYWTLEMVDGMSHVQDAAYPPKFVTFDGVQVLADYQDYNHYCYIVAGTVGNLATDLVTLHYQLPGTVAEQLLRYSQACGRGLQKTNIVKDFYEDRTRGICFLPDEWLSEIAHRPLLLRGAPRDWNRKVLFDILAELKEATEYTMVLPYEANGYRMSSLLCLLPALQTILHAAQNQGTLFTSQHPTKISHQIFAQCVLDARRLTNNNQHILEYYRQIEAQMNAMFNEKIP